MPLAMALPKLPPRPLEAVIRAAPIDCKLIGRVYSTWPIANVSAAPVVTPLTAATAANQVKLVVGVKLSNARKLDAKAMQLATALLYEENVKDGEQNVGFGCDR